MKAKKATVKHIKSYRSKGKLYRYHRKTGEPLPEDGEKAAAKAAKINETLGRGPSDVVRGSIDHIIGLYKASVEYKELAPRTTKDYDRDMKWFADSIGSEPIASIDVAFVEGMRDRLLEQPAKARKLMATLSILINTASRRGLYRAENPVKLVRKPKYGEYPEWPDSAVERFKKCPIPELVWAVELGLHTGQRGEDVIVMRWDQIRNGEIEVKQGKTGETVWIPIHSRLQAVLDRVERRATTILTRPDGRPWNIDYFRHSLKVEIDKLGLTGLTFHGLRKSASRRLAEAGCSERHIQAITGHQTSAMVQHYTKGARRKKLAKAAVVKLEQASNDRMSNSEDGDV